MPMTLATACHSDLLIRKSRFIGCVQPMSDRPAAQREVAHLRLLHPGATHVCWALLAGGHSAAVDDGEPGGTAGRPMLDVLRHQQLDGVMATVVRYFGGIRLGAGGLVRAYTDCVAQALLEADKRPLLPILNWRCCVPYAFEGSLRRAFAQAGAVVLRVEHGDGVRFDLQLAAGEEIVLQAHLSDLTQGRIEWQTDLS